MHPICSPSSNFKHDATNGSINSTIFYNFVGNFVPPEWKDLVGGNGKVLSKTARQLLSLVVFRLQIYFNNTVDELQETYCFFEQSLGVCQRRVRQCLVELEKSGFVQLSNATIIKHGIRCRNTPCIRLIRNFQPYPQKFSDETEKNFSSMRKNFRVNPKEISTQPEKSFASYIDIDNNKDKSNKSRSSKSEEIKDDQENIATDIGETFQQQQEAKEEQVAKPSLKAKKPDLELETRISAADSIDGALSLESIVANIVEKVGAQVEAVAPDCSNSNNSAVSKSKSWFRRKKLADFYPFNQEDADLLQVKSNREFNLNFINRLLLKLAAEYPEHHFGHKKVVLTYMAKALANELRESDKVNNGNFQFKSDEAGKFKEQYLTKIENSTDTSKEAQLKRKIAGIFDSDIAYELLSSCIFVGIEGNQYQIKLLKDISLSENVKAKMLQQVQGLHGSGVQQLQIIPLANFTNKNQENSMSDKNDKTAYLTELAKQLDPSSVWYKVREFLIERHSKYIDTTMSKLTVLSEDVVNKKISLKSSSAFYDYYIRNRHMSDLEDAFETQGFSFELMKFED